MAKSTHKFAKCLRGTLRILSGGVTAFIFSFSASAQSPSPSPSTETDDRYSVQASTEIGGRWLDVNGNENKFRSDLNYRSGLRVFDSSILIKDNGKGSSFKAFDSALIMASGWGADPGGFVRANIERDGVYRFDANVRRVAFYNFLNNSAIGETLINYHNYDTRRNFGDLDLTILPDNPKIRFRFGGSFNVSNGPFTYTTRASDAFLVNGSAAARSYDLRAGADGNLLGFNLAFTYGYRSFEDHSGYTLTAPQEGDRINNYDFISMRRSNPIDGRTHYGVLSVQRTFAKKLDFTARILHSLTTNEFSWNEFASYYNNSTTVITNDQINIFGDSSRPQTRGDLGITWRITDKFRLSNTFTYDGFNLNGGNLFAQDRITSTTALTRQFNYATTRYRRYTNLIEGDYQFNNRFGINVGYRYTRRDFSLMWIGSNILTIPPTPLNGSPLEEDGENITNTVIVGTRIKPLKNWSIFADFEKGQADTVFTRAGSADFTNFRVKSMMRFNRVSANVSYIDKQNEIPTDTTRAVPRITDISNRTFSATIDWNPIEALNLSGGYNYQHLTSRATVTFSGLPDALSEYFLRDHYFFIDATVKPHKRLTFFGSYRWNKDRSLNGVVVPPLSTTTLLLGAYPIDFKTPELRASVRLSRYLDWNIGYQYYDYSEEPAQNIQWAVPFQNYKAHMPYMSLRIYLGKAAGDR